MSSVSRQSLSAWTSWQTGVDRILSECAAVEGRVTQLVTLFRELVPTAPLGACHVRLDDTCVYAVENQKGHVLPADETGLVQELGRLGSGQSGPIQLTLPAASRKPATVVEGVAVAVRYRQRSWGQLVAAFPANATDAARADMEAIVTVAAAALGLQFSRAEQEACCRSLRDELKELDLLATVGEAVDGITHEFSNILNSMMLQASVVQLQVEEKPRADLAVILQQGNKAAGMLRRLRALRSQRRAPKGPVDVNAVLRDLLHEQPEQPPPAKPTYAPFVPPIQVARLDVKRLLRFLLVNAERRHPPAAGPLVVTTESLNDTGVRLTIEDAGAPTTDDMVANLFDGSGGLFTAAEEHERLVAETLIRRLGATLRVSNRAAGGVRMVVDLV